MALSGKELWLTALFFIVVTGQIAVQPDIQPEFLAPLENLTVTQGRDVHFTCSVNHLSDYKVAWIKSDSKAILAIHTHMVALNPRLSVTYNGHNTWKLHVANVQANDSGTYMCQINTDPMRSQMGFLEVVIPPDILNEEEGGGGEGVALEGGSVRLRCEATGMPPPTVVWKRESGRSIVFRHDAAREKKAVASFEGPILHLGNVQRTDMGSYFCIASNGVPPSVSKRYNVQVQFHPLIKVSNQLVAAPVDSDVVVQCYVEASPKAMNSWYRENGEKLLDSSKYLMKETSVNEYSLFMNLTIKKLERKDFGGYVCSSVNALGRVEGTVRLQELVLPSKPSSTHTSKVHEPKKNHVKHDNKHKNNNRGRKQQEYAKGRYDFTTRSWMDSRTPDYSDLDLWGSRPPWVDLMSNQISINHHYNIWKCLLSIILVSVMQLLRNRMMY